MNFLLRKKNQFIKQKQNEKFIMLVKYFKDVICEDLILKENIPNIHLIPHISSITINYSSGLLVKNPQFTVPALTGFQLMYGQKPKVIKAKKSVSGFQVRENQHLGCKLTLRRQRLFFFLEKLVFTIFPRLNIMDQKSLQKSHYHLGLIQTLLFPEVENYYDSFEFLKGCQLSMLLSAKSCQSSRLLLSSFKMITGRMNSKL